MLMLISEVEIRAKLLQRRFVGFRSSSDLWMMNKVLLKPGAKGEVHGQGFNRRRVDLDLQT